MLKKLNVALLCLCGASTLAFVLASRVMASVAGCPDEVEHLTGSCGSGGYNLVPTDTYFCRTSTSGLCCNYRKYKAYCFSDGSYIGYINFFQSATASECINNKCIPTPPPP